jgi:transposase
MTVTIVDAARPVTGGVDTHLDLNVAAALDGIGGLLAVAEFPTTSAGHRELLGWLSGFGPVARVGVEGTGSYGAGLARFLRAAGVQVVEVDRPKPAGPPAVGEVRSAGCRRGGPGSDVWPGVWGG